MRQHVLKLQEEREAFTSQLQQQGPKERCACVPDTWHSGISVTGVTGFHVTCPTGSVNPTTGQVHTPQWTNETSNTFYHWLLGPLFQALEKSVFSAVCSRLLERCPVPLESALKLCLRTPARS